MSVLVRAASRSAQALLPWALLPSCSVTLGGFGVGPRHTATLTGAPGASPRRRRRRCRFRRRKREDLGGPRGSAPLSTSTPVRLPPSGPAQSQHVVLHAGQEKFVTSNFPAYHSGLGGPRAIPVTAPLYRTPEVKDKAAFGCPSVDLAATCPAG